LLENGADVQAKNNAGRHPLHFAAEFGNLEACQCLVAKGANVNAEDENELTPFDIANGKRELFDFLTEHGGKESPSSYSTAFYAKVMRMMEDESLYPRAENMITGYLNQCSAQEANADPAILGVYAVLLEKKGDFSGAKLIYEKAKAAGEPTSTRLYNHALLLESPPFNDYNGAKTLYLEALTIDERDARVMFSLGDQVSNVLALIVSHLCCALQYYILKPCVIHRIIVRYNKKKSILSCHSTE
jgi:tetratricopeptide (TPR) repeat protein